MSNKFMIFFLVFQLYLKKKDSVNQFNLLNPKLSSEPNATKLFTGSSKRW